MLVNHFIPVATEALSKCKAVNHHWYKTNLVCGIPSDKSHAGSLTHTAETCVANDGEVPTVSQNTTSLFRLVLIDHQNNEEIALVLRGDSEDLLAINNAALAQVMLTDHVHFVNVRNIHNHATSTYGSMGMFEKSFMEIALIDEHYQELVHVFWVGEKVTNPEYGKHTSSV